MSVGVREPLRTQNLASLGPTDCPPHQFPRPYEHSTPGQCNIVTVSGQVVMRDRTALEPFAPHSNTLSEGMQFLKRRIGDEVSATPVPKVERTTRPVQKRIDKDGHWISVFRISRCYPTIPCLSIRTLVPVMPQSHVRSFQFCVSQIRGRADHPQRFSGATFYQTERKFPKAKRFGQYESV